MKIYNRDAVGEIIFQPWYPNLIDYGGKKIPGIVNV